MNTKTLNSQHWWLNQLLKWLALSFLVSATSSIHAQQQSTFYSMLDDGLFLETYRVQCQNWQATDGLSCTERLNPLLPTIIGERSGCINTSPSDYSTSDNIEFELSSDDGSNFRMLFNGFKQTCPDTISVEVSVDGQWFHLGNLPQSTSPDIIHTGCANSNCNQRDLFVSAIRACNQYTGSDCGGAPGQFNLAVMRSGSGRVTSSPSGIDCGNDCQASFDGGSQVTLTASPSSGWQFDGWGGACSGTSSTCTVDINNNDRTVTADFSSTGTNEHSLTVTRNGNGTVTSSPSGINCGTTCSTSFTSGSNVTLTASAASGHRFTGWGSACSGTSTTCTVAMSADRTVTANFEATGGTNNHELIVDRIGSGTITSSPTGINCGSNCSASFESGSNVVLTANPAPGNSFDGWTGACSGTSSTCIVTMSTTRTVSATFNPVSDPDDEPSAQVSLPTDPSQGCPGFFVLRTHLAPNHSSGRIGTEIILEGEGLRTFQGGLNFGGFASEEVRGFAAFSIANAASEPQTVEIELESPAPGQLMLERRSSSQGDEVLMDQATFGGVARATFTLSPGFYVVGFRPDHITTYAIAALTSYPDRPGGGFQGGAVVGGLHTGPDTSSFVGFCVANPFDVSVTTFSGPTYGSSGARGVDISLRDRDHNMLIDTRNSDPCEGCSNNQAFDSVSQLATGREHTCALAESGVVKCWGSNSLGQLGNSGPSIQRTPETVRGLPDRIIQIAAGSSHTCALSELGELYCWGNNSAGQLGIDRGSSFAVEPQLVPQSNVLQFDAGREHTCAIRRQPSGSSALFCWGSNMNGALGIGPTSDHHDLTGPHPATSNYFDGQVIDVATGEFHTCAWVSPPEDWQSDQLYCWGSGHAVGIDDWSVAFPTNVDISSTITRPKVLVAGGDNTCAGHPPGRFKCWGDNTYNQISDGPATEFPTPSSVDFFYGGFKDVSIGQSHICLLGTSLAEPGVWCQGRNDSGQIGSGIPDFTPAPVQDEPILVLPDADIIQVATGGQHTCAATTSKVYCWGDHRKGQLGVWNSSEILWSATEVDSLFD